MGHFNKLNPSDFLLKQSETIASFYNSRQYQGIILSFSDQFLELAPLFLCPYLEKHKIPINLIFLPDTQTDTAVYESISVFCSFYKINFKIVPIKFLQSLYKNIFNEHFGIDLSNQSNNIIKNTLEGIRQTLISTTAIDKNLLYLNATSKTSFYSGNPPLHLPMHHSLCPFGTLYNSDIDQLIKTMLPKELNNSLTSIINLLKNNASIEFDSCLEAFFVKKQPPKQMIDKMALLNNYAQLNHLDYFPII